MGLPWGAFCQITLTSCFTVGTVLVDMWRFVHQWSFFAVLTVFWLFLTIGIPIVTGLQRLYQQCTSCVPIVKNSQKTVKTAKMTIGLPLPIVECLHRVRRIHKADKTRMIRLPYDEKLWQYVKPFSSDTGTSRTGRQNCYITVARQCAVARYKV